MGKTKELLEYEWFLESQRAELHWMEQEYEQSKIKYAGKYNNFGQQGLG
jgi:hypothetical protein